MAQQPPPIRQRGRIKCGGLEHAGVPAERAKTPSIPSTGRRRGLEAFRAKLTYMFANARIWVYYMFMSKASRAIQQLPPSTAAAIEKLGADLAVARLRRRESLKAWAQRLGVSVPTLLRLEAGDPSVSLGIVATALWLIQRDDDLGKLASPETDLGAVELSVRDAIALGRARAKASAEARVSRRGMKDEDEI